MRTIRVIVNGRVDGRYQTLSEGETILELQHHLSQVHKPGFVRVIERIQKEPKKIERRNNETHD